MRNMKQKQFKDPGGNRPPSVVLALFLVCGVMFYHTQQTGETDGFFAAIVNKFTNTEGEQVQVVKVPVALLAKGDVQIFRSPNPNDRAIGYIHKGQEVNILEDRKMEGGAVAWYKVRSNGLAVWVKAGSAFEVIYG